MYRLGQLDETQRRRIGWSLVTVGTILLAIAVVWVHFASLVDDTETMGFIPRHWLSKGLGYLVAFGASQLIIAGATLALVLGRNMTWAVASTAALITWVELVVIFGIVPSEWLTFAATDLEWSSQRTALTIPPFLVLGNEVSLSYAAIKDSISAIYNVGMLGAAIVFAYKIQDLAGEGVAAPPEPEPTSSPYGRPLRAGDR